MNIVLLVPPWYRLQEACLSHYPPGPTYIAGALKQCGYDSIVWNGDYDPTVKSVVGGTNILNTDELTEKHRLYIQNLYNLNHPVWKDVEKKLKLFKPDVLGISTYSATFQAGLHTAQIAKSLHPDVITIFGGVHPTIDPKGVAMHEEVDFVVMGEGEITMQELVRAIDSGSRDYSTIKGIAYKANGSVRVNEKRELASDVDVIANPAREKLFEKELCPPSVFHMVYTSRGCPFHCVYCGSFNLWGRTKRSRSAESILEEVERTHKDYKTRYFYLCDDIFFFPGDIQRAYEFCYGLMKRRLNILWSTQTRAETINEETKGLLRLMKITGGQHISIGVETGSDRISRLIKKGNKVEHSRVAAQLIKRYGLHMSCFFMFGFPWETEEEIQQTIDLLRELDCTVAFPYIVTPAPGTELNRIAADMGLITPEFKIENFYHESPKMCLSVHIAEEKREEIISKTLHVFAEHNKRHFRKSLLERWRFYYALLHDNGVLEHPRLLFQHIMDALIPRKITTLINERNKIMFKSLKGLNVIITGASSGIGKSTALEFARAGANVALVSRNLEKLEAIKTELQRKMKDIKVVIIQTDLTEEQEVQEMVKKAAENLGSIDILINNAGVGMLGETMETNTENFRRLMEINYYSVFYAIKAVYPYMKANKRGQIVNITSAVSYKGFPDMGPYSASKFAVRGLSEALRFELKKDNISVILVSPGQTKTGFFENAFYEGKTKSQFLSKKGKGMHSEDVARAIANACLNNKKEVILGEGKIIATMNRLSPFLTDILVTMKGR